MQKKITVLEKTVKSLDKKKNQGNQQKYDNKNSNTDNITPRPLVMYCHSCVHDNDPLNVITNLPNPNTGHKWHEKFKRRYGWSEANCAEAWNGGPKNIAICSNVATNLSKQTYAKIIQSSTIPPQKTINNHTYTGASGIYLMRQPSLYK